jgi:hypothetical protein
MARKLTNPVHASLRRPAAAVRPWRWSTGPRTPAGKRRASYNGWRHGRRSLLMRAAKALARARAAYLSSPSPSTLKTWGEAAAHHQAVRAAVLAARPDLRPREQVRSNAMCQLR